MFIVDVFAEEKYSGNQLAVITGAASLSTAQMQKIARETNFSETTFILSDTPRDGRYDVRIFTPMAEIPFAGHPTLGTAWVLRNFIAPAQPREIVLNLQLAPIPVTFRACADGAELAWMQPPYPVFGRRFDPAPFAELLDLRPEDLDASFPVEEVGLGVPFTFIPLKTLAAIRRARFRQDVYEGLAHLGFNPALFLICPQTDAPANQLHVRMFAAAFGVPEDPATGSANACLGAYVLRHSYLPGDAVDLRVEQGYEIGRPSLLHVRARRRGDQADIEVGGRVILTARGELV
jgi:trans-2,3-dihydro-3-hydroxyanthranilate isomerase